MGSITNSTEELRRAEIDPRLVVVTAEHENADLRNTDLARGATKTGNRKQSFIFFSFWNIEERFQSS